MLTFKDVIMEDIMDVFFQPDLFTEKHEIGGKTCDALLYENAVENRDKKKDNKLLGRSVQGLYDRKRILLVPVSQMGPKPAPDSILTIDGHRRFQVISAEDTAGAYRIELEEMA